MKTAVKAKSELCFLVTFLKHAVDERTQQTKRLQLGALQNKQADIGCTGSSQLVFT